MQDCIGIIAPVGAEPFDQPARMLEAALFVAVGKGKEAAAWPAQVLGLRDRTAAGMTAPPQGLFLVGVQYPDISDFRFQISDLEAPDDAVGGDEEGALD